MEAPYQSVCGRVGRAYHAQCDETKLPVDCCLHDIFHGAPPVCLRRYEVVVAGSVCG